MADAAHRTDIWITKSLPELSSGETKITKILFFPLKYVIRNRYAYESRNLEMIKSKVTKNLSKFF